ncbi:MAG TPA: exopolysaccharide biosynthesis protein [Baekduia sp.]|nr:exopolysaccharide biosynthesis protein [Baekduia sp.]
MPTASEELEHWLSGDGDKTLGGLIARFEEKSFALLFILLLGVPALPLPTGGATHVFEVIAMLLALQLIAGRDVIWLPERWRRIELAGGSRERFLTKLMSFIRRLERHSRPRLAWLFGHRASGVVFGVLTLGGSLAAFLAPPFTGLDTLPALGAVLISLAVLMEDAAFVVAGVLVVLAGVALEIALGSAIVNGLGHVF